MLKSATFKWLDKEQTKVLLMGSHQDLKVWKSLVSGAYSQSVKGYFNFFQEWPFPLGRQILNVGAVLCLEHSSKEIREKVAFFLIQACQGTIWLLEIPQCPVWFWVEDWGFWLETIHSENESHVQQTFTEKLLFIRYQPLILDIITCIWKRILHICFWMLHSFRHLVQVKVGILQVMV